MGVVNHEENERGYEGLYLDSLINDHFLAYVSGPRFVNPIFYSLANFDDETRRRIKKFYNLHKHVFCPNIQ